MIAASKLRIEKPLSERVRRRQARMRGLASDAPKGGTALVSACARTGRVYTPATDHPCHGRGPRDSRGRLLDFDDPDAHVAGIVKGSPIVDGAMFFGFEHPLSWAKLDRRASVCRRITRQLPLRAGQSVTYSSVVGVAAPGQMRRDFLAYLEAERPRPYQPVSALQLLVRPGLRQSL